MANHDRYGDYQTRDRESSRYGRDMDERGRDQAGYGRSGGMFDTGWNRDADNGRDHQRFGGDRGDWRNQRRDREFGYDDRHEGLPIEETSRLIASNKVEGTAVYARDGARLGSIYNFMVDKRSGKVEYAVMSYGGFLGMGTRYYPLPWDILSYDTRLGGYHVDLLERELERAPSFDRSSEPNFDTSYGRRVRGWYGLNS